jgi:hypothetical protein
MRKFLAFSLLSLSLITNSYAKDVEKTPKQLEEEESRDIHQILKDIQCNTKEKINNMLEHSAGMTPIMIAHSDDEGYDVVVWAHLASQRTIIIKYHNGNGCIFSKGDYLILKYPDGLSSI